MLLSVVCRLLVRRDQPWLSQSQIVVLPIQACGWLEHVSSASLQHFNGSWLPYSMHPVVRRSTFQMRSGRPAAT